MHGILNGIQLQRITSIKTEQAGGLTLTTLRILDSPPPARLQKNIPAPLVLSDSEVEGRIGRFKSDEHGCEIMIESAR
jgi:hypothetical protein